MYIKDAASTEPDKILIKADNDVLHYMRYRLVHTRWPHEYANETWAYGTNRAWLQELCDYWVEEFDWQQQENWLNSFNHYRSEVGGLGIHYIHQRSPHADAVPVLLLHGWPGSFVQMLRLVPLLTDPQQGGQAFHVVVASLPGFGLSDPPAAPGLAMEGIAALMDKLMREVLGYSQYGLRGSDLGGTTIDQMMRHYPGHVLGAHLTQIIVAGGAPAPDDATQAEKDFLAASAQLGNTELAYARQHATKPMTLAYGLNDSPAGLAAWIAEKYRSWGDTGGAIESRFSKDFLLTTITLYWLTESIGPSVRTYYEMVRNRGNQSRSPVPAGFLMSMKDMFPPAPREWAERTHNVVRYTQAERGGHFLEWEEPALVAHDMQAFFSTLRPRTTA